MKIRTPFLFRLSVVLITISLVGCEFDSSGIPTILSDYAPLTEPTESKSKVILHAPGQLYVTHGHYCGQARLPNAVHMVGSVELPTTKFTGHVVYLNGWKLRFLSEESELVGFGAGIGESKIQGKWLNWDAVGTISDEDFDQSIEFCYWYTVVAWTDFMPNASTVQEDLSIIREYRNGGGSSALSVIPRYLFNPKAEKISDPGVLPKGFGFLWGDYDEDYFLQAAYRLGPSQPYIYGKRPKSGSKYLPAPTMPVSPPAGATVDWVNKGFTSWNSTAIFKNGDSADSYIFGDLVVGFADNNLTLIDPHFDISPRRQSDMGGGEARQQKITIENVPFHFATPVLKGWNINLPIDDEEVREIGIWIDSFEYKRTGPTGRLTYRLRYTFEDDDSSISNWDPGIAIFGVKQIWPD